MDEYKIVITPDAETDLNELDDYLFYPDIKQYSVEWIKPRFMQ